jgi:hypothetical protein
VAVRPAGAPPDGDPPEAVAAAPALAPGVDAELIDP